MTTTAVCGLQWGDEGKGKLVTRLAENHKFVVRYQGGGNAGHTVYVDGKKIVLHHLPSGVVAKGTTCLLMPGMVINPVTVLEELEEVKALGFDTVGRIWISNRAQITAVYHRSLDQKRESGEGVIKIGTTGRGIGNTYADKAMRFGVRACDLLDPDSLFELVQSSLVQKNLQLTAWGEEEFDPQVVTEELLNQGRQLEPYITDTSMQLVNAIEKGDSILFEGAQAAMLDLDMGTYPYVTSSTCLPGGISAGCGVNVGRVGKVIGVAKAYCTRVGLGGFPTEELGDAATHMRDVGGEYGSTTGRPRRCGWFDTHAVRVMVRLGQIDGICLTKLDVLSGLDEIKLSVGYENWSQEGLPASHREFDVLKPKYLSFKGFDADLSSCKTVDEFPQAARDFIKAVEEHSGVPVRYISTGPKTDQLIDRGA